MVRADSDLRPIQQGLHFAVFLVVSPALTTVVTFTFDHTTTGDRLNRSVDWDAGALAERSIQIGIFGAQCVFWVVD